MTDTKRGRKLNSTPKVGHSFWGVFMKYSYEKKLEVVLSVIRGDHSARTAARHFGVGHTHIDRWVALYREFGEIGLQRMYRLKLWVLKYMR